MKKIWNYFFLLISINSFGQNLISNPSFEDTVQCPFLLGQVTKAVGWYDLANTPDYFNECCVIPAVGVPSNTCGYQYPATGKAYMGCYTYIRVPDTNYREVIGSYLISPLIIGVKYYVHFKISFAGSPFQAINIATNKTGILFSTVDYLSSPPPVNNFSQVYADTIIADSVHWTSVRGQFIADSAYSFISIGNFFLNAFTDTVHLHPFNHTRAYYYIDDVCVSDDSLYTEVWTGFDEELNQNPLKIFPNPVTDILHIQNLPYGCNRIEVYDIYGVKQFLTEVNINSAKDIDVSQLKNGMYSLVFILKRNKYFVKKFIHIKTK